MHGSSEARHTDPETSKEAARKRSHSLKPWHHDMLSNYATRNMTHQQAANSLSRVRWMFDSDDARRRVARTLADHGLIEPITDEITCLPLLKTNPSGRSALLYGISSAGRDYLENLDA